MSGGLSLSHVTKSYGALTVIEDINLSIQPGEFLVLLGGSGCGKSTLLRLISGLEEELSGKIEIDGRDVTHLDPKDRNVAMVFQSYALYPHMSVFDNIAFGMRIRKAPKNEIKTEVSRVAKVLQLDDYLKRKPSQLSGGQRQRVAIGRAMVREPKIFLFDEPLSNLDAKLRAEMRSEIKRIHKALGATIVYVTHDQIEAMTLADKIVLLKDGHIEQMGTPEELYMKPKTLYTAKFIGSPEINTLPVSLSKVGDSICAKIGEYTLPLPPQIVPKSFQEGQSAILAIRPECLFINSDDDKLPKTEGHAIEMFEPMGSETSIVLDFTGHPLRMRETGLKYYEYGGTHSVSWDLSDAHLFDPDTGHRL